MNSKPEQIEAAFNRLRDAKYVGSDQNARDIVTLLDAYEAIRARVQELEKKQEQRDGKWIDSWGCCKVCDGEIPHGHSPNCDIYKLEMAARDITKDHSAEVQKCFDDTVQLFCDGGFRYDTLQQFANALLTAAGRNERVK